MRFILLFAIIARLSTSTEKNDGSSKESSHVVRQTGHIAVNDSEITLLINSTFEIIEDFETNGTEFETILEEKSSTAAPTSTRYSPRFHKFRSTTPVCRQFSQTEKYEMLEHIGARNQLFMADSPAEASRGFASAYPEPHTAHAAYAADVMSEIDPEYCDARCEMIKNSLEKAVQEQTTRGRQSDTPMAGGRDAGRRMNDAGKMEVDEGISFGGSCFLESFIPIGNCSELGEDASWTHERLCSECRGIYMLNQNCFPSFFNTVRCNTQEMGCIFDTFSDKAHGECQSQSLAFKVLRNRGDSRCEDWVYEEIMLPVACQCMLSKNSFLRSQPPSGEL